MSNMLEIRRQIDAVCNKFEAAWSASLSPDFDSFLKEVSFEHRESVLRALLEVDIELRKKCSLPIDPKGYLQLGDDAVLVVSELIKASSSLNRDEATTDSKINRTASSSKQIGPYKLLQQIGEGGMGTVWMAEQVRPVRRRVALKVIKAGMDTEQVIARFEAERQALAMMDHHNIAKVLDAGVTEDGRPYFAMELVQGIPITEYCDRNRLSLDERLKLFLPVCKAIQHAHQKGIIHRDVKPSNVMVTLYENNPVPKVIDFGLAKALQHQTRLTDKTMFTEFGQVIGTLQYMSPEQAEMNALDVDSRTDVYSLGVMLYELLTDSTPLDKQTLIQTPFLEILREIKEREPPRPSSRLSNCGIEIQRISDQRKIDARKLQQVLRGELDWIVMKALEKDRTRRYETANALADDVTRYLNNEAVSARPPTTAYRIRKFVGKNKLIAGSTVLVTFVMLIAIVLIGLYASAANDARKLAESRERGAKLDRIQADDARDLAEQHKTKANEKAREAEAATILAKQETEVALEVQRFLQESFLKKASIWEQANSQNPDGNKNIRQDVSVRDLLDDAAREYSPETIQQRFPNKPLVQAEILETIGEAYSAVKHHETAVAFLTAACAIRTREFDEQSPQTVQGRISLLFVLISAENHREAVEILDKIVDAFYRPYMSAIKALADGEEEQVIQRHLHLAEQIVDATINALESRIHPRRLVMPSFRKPVDISPSLIFKMVSIVQKFHDLDKDFQTRYDVNNRRRAYARFCLGLSLFLAGDRDKSVVAVEQSLEWVEREYGKDDPLSAGVAVILASVYDTARQKPDAIVPLLERSYHTMSTVLGKEHPTTIITGLNLADAYEINDQLDKSVLIREEIVFIQLSQLGLGHSAAFESVEEITIDYRALGQNKKALEIAERFYNETRDALGETNYTTFQAMEDFAYCLNADGQRERGNAVYQELIQLSKSEHGDKDEKTLHFIHMLANSLYSIDDYEQALPLFQDVYTDRVAVLGPLDHRTLETLENLAKSFRELKQYDDAVDRFKELIGANLEKFGPRKEETILSQAMLAECVALGGRTDEAIACFEPLVNRANKSWGETDFRSIKYLSELARLWTDKGEFETALSMRRTLVDRERQLAKDDSNRSLLKLSNQLFELANVLKLSDDLDGAINACTECLEIRQKNWPDHRIQFETKSLLGECLCLSGQLETGEPLLTQAYSGLQLLHSRTNDDASIISMRQTASRLVDAYEKVNRPTDVEKWQAEMKKLENPQPPDN